ncbi:MAG: integration host factor subunit beta [Phycisphaerae bacterium]|nr:integration host factor subunit beta [Phycisphaerae bacterium]
MQTITKRDLIDRLCAETGLKRVDVKRVIQDFLDEVVLELGKGNRLEFRDFGVFEVRTRAARKAQNPKTLAPVQVPARRAVKFKVGRLMKQSLDDPSAAQIEIVRMRAAEAAVEHNGVHVRK